MEDKKPMVHIHLNQANDIKITEGKDGVYSISEEIKHMVQWVHERLDDDIIRSIVRMARAEGVTDVTIMDKREIMQILQKSSRQKPIWTDKGHVCPRCMENKSLLGLHCDNCGQAIDWEVNSVVE